MMHALLFRPSSLLLIALVMGAIPARADRVDEARPLMGTIVEITAEGSDEAMLHAAVDDSYHEMGRLSDMMNHYDPHSVVSAINDAAGLRAVTAPPELMEVLAMARRVSERTGGAFDITIGALRGWRFRQDDPRVPSREEILTQLKRVDFRKVRLDAQAHTVFLAKQGMRIDLGGIAKLYIVHAGIKVLARRGIQRALVNGGGDVEVIAPPDTRPWRIGVRDPRAPEKLIGVLELHNGFVISSGDYERYFVRDGKRYHHILDPRTGSPSQGPHGVTLVGRKLEAINGFSLSIMVLGKNAGVGLIRSTPGLDGLIVDHDGSSWMSKGFTDRLRAAR